ncbi:hypothetical protein [Actinotalea sp. K2]|uniref:hypothetical protein n=1 Tax=Actinotalea sp. K2 TaxID=2939438 RepID=UPI00201830C2|nr:hypothetical protein [Actinotalea sp. K2]MCL3861601.1 hypothetical protein [Actinotalea sp. K2]
MLVSRDVDLRATLADLRSSLRADRGDPSPWSESGFDTPVEEVARWLGEAAAKCASKDFLLEASDDDVVDTLYVEVGSAPQTAGAWSVSAYGFGRPPRRFTEVPVSEFLDEALGCEIGDVRLAPLVLGGTVPDAAAGSEPLRATNGQTLAPDGDERVEHLALLTAADLVDRALHGADLDLRVALAHRGHDRVLMWQRPGSEAAWSRQELLPGVEADPVAVSPGRPAGDPPASTG